MKETNGRSRRAFLKGSAAAVAGVATSKLSVARAAHTGSEQLKVALVGCGGRGAGAAMQALKTDGPVKLWAVADIFPDRIGRCLNALTQGQESRYDREKHKGFSSDIDVPPERQFVGFDAYQKAIDSGVDVVILATPPVFRPQQYAAAVEAGKHVFMEKPVCVDAPGYRQIVENNKKADEKGLKVVVGLQRRSHPDYIETIKRIHDGAIGDIEYLRVFWYGGLIGTVSQKSQWTLMEYQLRNWNMFGWISGDHIVEQHVHNIDIGLWVKGDHPVEAQGMGGRQVRKGKDNGDIFDHHAVEFTFADGTRMFSQCRQMNGCRNSISELAHGTKGESDCCGRIRGTNPWRNRGSRNQHVNSYQLEHDKLFKAIRNDEKLNEGWHAATSTMAGILGRMATYSGQLVKWDDAIAKGPSQLPERLAMDAAPPVLPDPDGTYESSVAVPGIYVPY